MTTNIDRAAQIITECVVMMDERLALDTARRLADEGLLTPDLPEPQTFPSGEREWSTLDGFVNLDTDGTITVAYTELDEDDLAAGAEIDPGELVFTKISEARNLALALRAAADHAEEVGRANK